ncbi:TnsA-like heteromeric transposase endonuclease subunit [Streptomyces sp. NPDC052101]|uniref:TnsA-like heteromeric transposase endonuclease subunit n=1 Tax=Streptomyces sp. NPDC052101 TaxID=3155763 RepID=UPI0034409E8C
MAIEAFADVGHGVFEVEYVDEDRVRRREPLPAVWTARFESLPPVRKVRTYAGQRSVTRDYWSTTMRKSFACESRLERDHAMLMDFDPQVTGLVSQPFRLFWPTRRGRLGHVPDFFARRVDGTGVVVDVRPEDRIEPDDAEAFAATERVCELAGWSFRRVGVISPVLLANLRWLRGYGHPRCWRQETAGRLLEVFAEPRPLLSGAEAAGDRIAVLPVLYHLLWRGMLATDVKSQVLGPDCTVRRPQKEGGLW